MADSDEEYIHSIDANFMGHDSLRVRGLGAGLSWRNEEDIENDIFQCAVMGHFERVRYLVEVKRVQVNQRDKWDSTPLYYACLAGHKALARYLLEQGARCEENTFDGERCFHAALTDDIRDMLREYKAISRAHDPFSDFLRNSFFYHADGLSVRDEERPPHSDIDFIVKGTHAWAHRVVLAARSDYFKGMFRTRWRDSQVRLDHPRLDVCAFKAVLHYLYTERLQVPRALLDETTAMAKQCRLWDLHKVLQREIKKQDLGIPLPERVVVELADVCRIAGIQQNGPTPLQISFEQLAMRSMRGAFAENEEASDAEEDMFEDIVFNVDNKLFKCHKFFFCGRSEYFRALVTGNFKEGEGHIVAEAAIGHVSQASTHEITLTGVSAEAFVFLVDFMYTDNLNSALPFIQAMRRRDNQSQDGEEEADIEWQLIYEVLQLSDMYMLPVLRHLSTILLTQHINMSNLFDLIDIAQLMDLQRLYESIIQFMSLNLNEIFRQQKDALLEVIRLSSFDSHNIANTRELKMLGCAGRVLLQSLKDRRRTPFRSLMTFALRWTTSTQLIVN